MIKKKKTVKRVVEEIRGFETQYMYVCVCVSNSVFCVLCCVIDVIDVILGSVHTK